MFAKVALLIFLYYCTYYLYTGLLQPVPALGDSWDYHIPISQSILDGSFLTLPHPRIPQWYYPGSSEAINSLFLLVGIPLTLSNLFAIICLSVALYFLARTFKLTTSLSLLFSLSFCSLNVVVRWMNAVSIDVWVAVWFTLLLILLERPRPSIKYFLLLGLFSGLLIGSKYPAIPLLVILFGFYFKKLLPHLSLIRISLFIIPFSLLGLSWYLRNYLLVGNPIYPLPLLGLPYVPIFSDNIWKITLQYPIIMLNAFISEYHWWLFSPIIGFLYIIKNLKLEIKNLLASKLFLIGLINLLLYLYMPTSAEPQIMVSSLRYSYPIFIPLILGIFLLAQKYQLQNILGVIAIANSLNVLTMAYYPKLVFIYLPLALVLFRFIPRDTSRGNLK